MQTVLSSSLWRNLCVCCLAGRRVAEALHMNYAFLCEFEELHSAKRAARDQVLSRSLLRLR